MTSTLPPANQHIMITKSAMGVPILTKSDSQKRLALAMQNETVVFGAGPAGTGKTFLAVAYGAAMLRAEYVERLIFTRPAVEAGENLGFLPGDLQEKVNPYMQPLWDALLHIMGRDDLARFQEAGRIEVAPLAFMRGRNLTNAIVILDEAQNTTPAQMKMFLTRLSKNTKMIVVGDPMQADLKDFNNGLLDARSRLQGIEDIAWVHLEAKDIVRHPLVVDIVNAYEQGPSHRARRKSIPVFGDDYGHKETTSNARIDSEDEDTGGT